MTSALLRILRVFDREHGRCKETAAGLPEMRSFPSISPLCHMHDSSYISARPVKRQVCPGIIWTASAEWRGCRLPFQWSTSTSTGQRDGRSQARAGILRALSPPPPAFHSLHLLSPPFHLPGPILASNSEGHIPPGTPRMRCAAPKVVSWLLQNALTVVPRPRETRYKLPCPWRRRTLIVFRTRARRIRRD